MGGNGVVYGRILCEYCMMRREYKAKAKRARMNNHKPMKARTEEKLRARLHRRLKEELHDVATEAFGESRKRST